jgi:hypothetical protein
MRAQSTSGISRKKGVVKFRKNSEFSRGVGGTPPGFPEFFLKIF